MNNMNSAITDFILDRMSKKEYNSMKEIDAFAFGTPLVGFAKASDPLFADLVAGVDMRGIRQRG